MMWYETTLFCCFGFNLKQNNWKPKIRICDLAHFYECSLPIDPTIIFKTYSNIYIYIPKVFFVFHWTKPYRLQLGKLIKIEVKVSTVSINTTTSHSFSVISKLIFWNLKRTSSDVESEESLAMGAFPLIS